MTKFVVIRSTNRDSLIYHFNYKKFLFISCQFLQLLSVAPQTVSYGTPREVEHTDDPVPPVPAGCQ